MHASLGLVEERTRMVTDELSQEARR